MGQWDRDDVDILSRSIVGELLERAAENQATAPGQAISPLGGKKYLESEGLAAEPVDGSQKQPILQKDVDVPRGWIITMSGKITQPSVAGAPVVGAWPFAKFNVEWGAAGASYETEVDGFSDQFLAVWGNHVNVSCEWDFANFARFNVFPTGAFPARMEMNASISPSDGAITKAWRTFVLPVPAVGTQLATYPVPYGAVGVTIRQNTANPNAPCIFDFGTAHGGFNIEHYTAAEVQAAHDRGEYLSVPSMSDVLNVTAGPAPASNTHYYVEFLVQP